MKAAKLVGLKEAADLMGIEKSNLIRDHGDKPEFPKPIAVLSCGPIWRFKDIERYAKAVRRK